MLGLLRGQHVTLDPTSVQEHHYRMNFDLNLFSDWEPVQCQFSPWQIQIVAAQTASRPKYFTRT